LLFLFFPVTAFVPASMPHPGHRLSLRTSWEAASVRPAPRQQQLLQLLCGRGELSGGRSYINGQGRPGAPRPSHRYRGLKQLQRGAGACRKAEQR